MQKGLDSMLGNRTKSTETKAKMSETRKGKCYHDCSYCYMKRWGKLNTVRFDKIELKSDLGTGNFIFVGSSCDMFAENIPDEWVIETLDYCKKFDLANQPVPR